VFAGVGSLGIQPEGDSKVTLQRALPSVNHPNRLALSLYEHHSESLRCGRKTSGVPNYRSGGYPRATAGLSYVLWEVGWNRESERTRYEALMRKQRLSASVVFLPVILRKMRAMGISKLGR
jgi:hypothetical protein